MKIRYARVRNDLYEVIRVRSITIYIESTSRNEMEQVIVEIYFIFGSLNDVP